MLPWILEKWKKVFFFLFETKELGFNFHCLWCFIESPLKSLAHFYLAEHESNLLLEMWQWRMLEAGFIWASPHKKLQADPSAVGWNKGLLAAGQSSPARSECHQSRDLWPQGCKGGERSQYTHTQLHWDIEMPPYSTSQLSFYKKLSLSSASFENCKTHLKIGQRKKNKEKR